MHRSTCIGGAVVHISLKTLLTERYEGPEFEEYCIDEGKYLPASRDRAACLLCPLSNLCQSGFHEQIRRVEAGENPSLAAGCSFIPKAMSRDALLNGLTPQQIGFVVSKVRDLQLRAVNVADGIAALQLEAKQLEVKKRLSRRCRRLIY